MELVLKHLSNIYAIDRPTIIVICVLCAIAGYVIKEYLASPIMVVFVYPVLVLFSVLVQYSFITFELFPLKKIDQWLMWTIMASICGNILGIAAVALLGSVREFTRSKKPFRPATSAQGRL
jgi:hypothetical protein